MKVAAESINVEEGEHLQEGVFEYDHSHDPVDEEDEGGTGPREEGEDDEDIQEVDYAPLREKASLFQCLRERSQSQVPEDVGGISSEEEVVHRSPALPSGSRTAEIRS
jgi:hypothetical protein